ncbi:MAG: arylsulfatase [Verrucomicrobia bacterium]|nr:arylsulfatase [Verrucomicrobiota bacterium]
MRTRLLLLAAIMLPSGLHGSDAGKPNILLILADDLGYSDLGCYGGEIATPNLDALAQAGLRFRQFYNSARCSPTRAAILTGLQPHQAGFPNLGGKLGPNSVTLAEVLKPAGYRTLMVGKWHLNERNPPTERGFDEFYGMLGGFNSCWQEDPFYTRWPPGRTKREYAKDQFYSTDVFADYALDFIGKPGPQPWFLYLAFNAPHFPLHAPEADIARYESMYFEKGWDRIREERLARQKNLGLVPADLALTPRATVPANWVNVKTGWADRQNPAWDSLPEDRRRDLARRMAVYAAMVDRMDRAVGRTVAHLKTTGQLDNTVIIFLSDNGACAEWDPWGFDQNSGPQNVLHTGAALKEIGAPGSYVSYGSGWAHACNTPWRLFKHYTHEGGVLTPCIVHWPAGLKAPGLAAGPGHITDFMPTLCALTGAKYPTERDGTAILPQEGLSLLPAFNGEALPKRQICIEHEGHRSVRDNDWKLVALAGKPWELYHLATDLTEMRDLAAKEPQRVQDMAAAWDDWAARCNVQGKRAAAGAKPTKH